MSRLYHIVICAFIIVLMITAGCTSLKTTPGVDATTSPTQPSYPGQVTTAPVTGSLSQPATNVPQTPSGTCTANVQSDTANCGQCGYACPQNALCQEGRCSCREGYAANNNQCVAVPAETLSSNGCPAGMSPCADGYCYELESSTGNCGMCQNACPSGLVCVASTCSNIATATTTAPVTTAAVTTSTTTSTTTKTTIAPGLGTTLVGPGLSKSCAVLGKTTCDGLCVNTSTDSSNCGTCGKVCKSLTPNCCGGSCVNYLTDRYNCGSCGHTCSLSSTCNAGSCSVKIMTGTTILPRVTTIPQFVPPIYQMPVGP